MEWIPPRRPRLDVSILVLLILLVSYFSCKAQLSMPLQKMKINSGFGYRKHPVTHQSDYHKGIDLYARNEPVFAIFDGQVLVTGHHPILGNFIRIDHGGLISIYGHLSIILITKGVVLKSGDLIAVTGATGRVTGGHLHLSICSAGTYLDPIKFFLRYLDMNKDSIVKGIENEASISLRKKLELLVDNDEIVLTAAESEVYGTELADKEEQEDG